MGPVAIVVLAAGVAGCVTTDKRSYSDLSAAKAAKARVGEIIRLNKCPVTEPERQEMGSIRPSAAPPGVGLVVGVATTAISGAIKEAKDGLSGQFLAYGAYSMSDAETPENSFEFECVTLARGMIGPLGEGLPEQGGDLQRDHLDNLGLADYPAFYLELKAERKPPTSKQLTLTPKRPPTCTTRSRARGWRDRGARPCPS